MNARFVSGLLGAGLLFASLLSAQTAPKDSPMPRTPSKTQVSNTAARSMVESTQAVESTDKLVTQSMSQAIAWEQFKDAAAERQARLEARHPSVTNSNADRSMQESKPEKTVKDPGPTVRKDK
jgi:hypothetical protein